MEQAQGFRSCTCMCERGRNGRLRNKGGSEALSHACARLLQTLHTHACEALALGKPIITGIVRMYVLTRKGIFLRIARAR